LDNLHIYYHRDKQMNKRVFLNVLLRLGL